MGSQVYTGKVWTNRCSPPGNPRSSRTQPERRAIAGDIWLTWLLTISQLYNVKAASILAVSDNVITGEMVYDDPSTIWLKPSSLRLLFKRLKSWKENKWKFSPLFWPVVLKETHNLGT